jgi:hypothetical protein
VRKIQSSGYPLENILTVEFALILLDLRFTLFKFNFNELKCVSVSIQYLRIYSV